MKPPIAVVDYGMGNLRSVEKALEKVGACVQITRSPVVLRKAKGVVVPGVGAFGEAVKRLTSARLMNPLMQSLESGRPFLGICLGLQLLFERSEESPRARGFGFIKGSVVRFPNKRNLKVPHMGWNTLEAGETLSSRLKGISSRDYFYFVHSFYPQPDDLSCVSTRTAYGLQFCSSVTKGSLFASQFHPEKSGAQGLRILRNFVKDVERCS